MVLVSVEILSSLSCRRRRLLLLLLLPFLAPPTSGQLSFFSGLWGEGETGGDGDDDGSGHKGGGPQMTKQEW